MSSDLTREINKIKQQIRYYTNIQQTKELKPKQANRLKELQDKLHELQPIPSSRRKYATYEEYAEANRKRSLEKYYRLKAERENKLEE